MIPFLVVQTFYWLALSTWWGGAFFVAIMAPVIFRTVRDENPILPTVLSVNLENQHGSLLSGAIVGNILQTLSNIQFVCAAVIFIMLIGHWFVMQIGGINTWLGVLRSTVFVAAVGLAAYDRFIVWPKTWKFRQEYIDHADEPEIANPAKDNFDRYHRESLTVLFGILALLSLMIVFSAVIEPSW
jgi:hypothetical protein